MNSEILITIHLKQELIKCSGPDRVLTSRFNLSHGPSDDWFQKFLRRHSNLKWAVPQTITTQRQHQSSDYIIDDFFNKYGEPFIVIIHIMKTIAHDAIDTYKSITNRIMPQYILNCRKIIWSIIIFKRIHVVVIKTSCYIYLNRAVTEEIEIRRQTSPNI